jgi:hypothetical protein
MTETEYSQIEQALDNVSSEGNLDDVCQKILLNRLRWADQPDRKLRHLLEDVVKTMKFPLKTEAKMVDDSLSVSANNETIKIVSCVIAFIIGICMVTLAPVFVRIAGGILSAIGGYSLNNVLLHRKLTTAAEIKVTTTVKDICNEIDSIYEVLSKFYQYRQLEGRQIKILMWFQHHYSECKDRNIQDSISKLLVQFGYRFVEYVPEISADFEINSGNVKEPVTTEPAIYNEQDSVVCKGTAVIPNL